MLTVLAVFVEQGERRINYPADFVNKVIQGDALAVLKTLPDEIINCVVTSPPYWNLRDYSVEGQLGLEKTFEEYISKLCDIFDEIKRILRKDGTCWVNLGDTYNSHTFGKSNLGGGLQKKLVQENEAFPRYRNPPKNLGDKSLCLIPFRFAIEMVNHGWICRNVIIWHKPNCMPSSVKDRFTVDFEYLFFFVKSRRYWFEQQFEESITPAGKIWKLNTPKTFGGDGHINKNTQNKNREDWIGNGYRNKRTVWTIPTKPYPEAHFAVYPAELIRTCIQAGCPRYVCNKCGKAREKIYDSSERINTRPGKNVNNSKSGKSIDPNQELHKSDLSKYRQQIMYKEIGYTDCGCNAGFSPGIVLDPFAGSGTTLEETIRQGKDYIGIELKSEYIELIKKRLDTIPNHYFRR